MKDLGFSIWVALLLAIVSTFIFNLKIDAVGIGFLINTVTTSFLMALFSRSLSLALVYYIFTLLFLCIVPWLHYSNGILIWRSSVPKEMIFHTANLLVFVANVALCVVSFFIFKQSRINPAERRKQLYCGSGFFLIIFAMLMSFAGLLITLYLNDFSIEAILLRGAANDLGVVKIDESSIQLLVGNTSRFLPFYVFVYFATEVKGCRALKLLLFLNVVITTFPSGIPRYMVAMIYVPLLLIYVNKLNKGSNFAFFLIASVLFVFPFLDQFRLFQGLENIYFLPRSEFFEAAHFDAYENLISAIDYGFVTNGRQLLGALLFFVPRVIWGEKPIGSGSQMAEDHGFEFTNISMPLLGEFYVNFGFLGGVVLPFFVFYFFRLIDSHYAINSYADHAISYRRVLYFYQMGSLFFILRGDLMSSFAYFVSGLVVYYAVGYVLERVRS